MGLCLITSTTGYCVAVSLVQKELSFLSIPSKEMSSNSILVPVEQ